MYLSDIVTRRDVTGYVARALVAMPLLRVHWFGSQELNLVKEHENTFTEDVEVLQKKYREQIQRLSMPDLLGLHRKQLEQIAEDMKKDPKYINKGGFVLQKQSLAQRITRGTAYPVYEKTITIDGIDYILSLTIEGRIGRRGKTEMKWFTRYSVRTDNFNGKSYEVSSVLLMPNWEKFTFRVTDSNGTNTSVVNLRTKDYMTPTKPDELDVGGLRIRFRKALEIQDIVSPR